MRERIGDNWDEDVWITEEWFQQNRDLANQMASILARVRMFREPAGDDLKFVAGQAYHDEVVAKLTLPRSDFSPTRVLKQLPADQTISPPGGDLARG